MLFCLITTTRRSLAAFGVVVWLSSGALAADPEYLAAVADLPLPPGMVEEVDAGVSFDKPEGRIIEAVARGAVVKADVAAFYRAALPGLGWQCLDSGPSDQRWQRSGEVLIIKIVDGSNPLIVRFSIAPN